MRCNNPFISTFRKNCRFASFFAIAVCVILPKIAPGNEFGVSRRNSIASSQFQNSSSLSSPPIQAVTSPVTPQNLSQSTNLIPASKSVQETKVASSSESSRQTLQNVVRLIAFDKSGQSFGSGSYIGNYGEYGLILSNWHVVCESDGLVHIHFPNGFSTFGAVMLSDKKWDLALIATSKPPESISPLRISTSSPKPSEPLWIAGHGSGSYRLAGGYCVRYLAPEIPKDGTPPIYEIVELSVSARQGDSGGPILNQHGELAGVLFGSDMIRNTAGSCNERVNRFLNQTQSVMDAVPQRPENFFAQIETNGPRHSLSESFHTQAITAPQTAKNSADISRSATSFGIPSGSRRYVPANTTISDANPFEQAPRQ